jgi:hypothetical protein
MNIRKQKKQITKGNTFMPNIIGNGRGNYAISHKIPKQLELFKQGVTPEFKSIPYKVKPKRSK